MADAPIGSGTGDFEALLARLRAATAEQAPELLGLLDEVEARRAGEIARDRELFDRAPGAYLVTNARGKILSANRAAAEILAGGRGVDGRLLASFLTRDDRPPFRRALLLLERESGLVHIALPLRRGTAQEAAILATARPVQDEQPLQIHWLLVDRAELHQAERDLPPEDELVDRLVRSNVERLREAYRELERERKRLDRVLDHFPDGLIALGSDARVLYANAAARRILSPAPLGRGEQLPDLWPELSLPAYAAGLLGARRPPDERRLDLADGRVVAISGIPYRPGTDAFLLLADLTAETRRARIEHEFVRNAAHELRTPLAAISSAVEVLQAGAKEIPADRDHFLGHLEQQAERLRRLTRSLLLLARVQAGLEAPRLARVSVKQLLEEVAGALHQPEGVRVEVACPPLVAVLADHDLVEQAVLNLATNAVRHSHGGAVRLTTRPAGERSVAIEVSDEGDGIPAEDRDRLLEPFYRGRAHAGDGFGLGLAISNEAIAALGGSLELVSEPGAGTLARVTLRSAPPDPS